MHEYEWHKYPNERPQAEEKKYLVCDQYGHINIKLWGNIHRRMSHNLILTTDFDFLSVVSRTPAKNVYYWTELPDAPTINNEMATKLEALKREKQKINDEIRAIKRELTGSEPEVEE